ncbi:deoxyxylulose-5-phosphate synthase [Streptomyces sp. NPDC001450]
MSAARASYVCLSCRVSYKQCYDPWRERTCPRCAGALTYAGSAFAAPSKRDRAALRTLREVRERMTYARRTGEPAATALRRGDLP